MMAAGLLCWVELEVVLFIDTLELIVQMEQNQRVASYASFDSFQFELFLNFDF